MQSTKTVNTLYGNIVLSEGTILYSNGSVVTLNFIEYNLDNQTITSIEKINEQLPKLYPNPTNSTIALNSEKEYNIEVYTIDGVKLMDVTGNILNLSHLSNAIYIYCKSKGN